MSARGILGALFVPAALLALREMRGSAARRGDVQVWFEYEDGAWNVKQVRPLVANVTPLRLLEMVRQATGGAQTVESWSVPGGTWTDVLRTIRSVASRSGIEVLAEGEGTIVLRREGVGVELRA
jgi:hypothetical protein